MGEEQKKPEVEPVLALGTEQGLAIHMRIVDERNTALEILARLCSPVATPPAELNRLKQRATYLVENALASMNIEINGVPMSLEGVLHVKAELVEDGGEPADEPTDFPRHPQEVGEA